MILWVILTSYMNVKSQIFFPELSDTLDLDSLPEYVKNLEKDNHTISLNTNGRTIAEKTGWDEYKEKWVFVYRTERYKSLITCKDKTLQIKTDRYTMKIEMKDLKHVITELDNNLTHFIYYTEGTYHLIITYDIGDLYNIGLLEDNLCYYYFYTPYSLDDCPISKD